MTVLYTAPLLLLTTAFAKETFMTAGKTTESAKSRYVQTGVTILTMNMFPLSPPSFHNRPSAVNYIEEFNSKLSQAIYTSLDQIYGQNTSQKNTRLKLF
jgi:hypothetical protein